MKNHSNNHCRHFIGLRTRRKTHRWVSERQAVSCSWVSERQESRVRAVLICRVYYSVDVAPVRVLTCVGPVASKYKRFLRFSVPRTPSLNKSTRLWEWNSREKKVSYASGDSSKYFRRLPFLFLPLAGKREKRVGAETEKGDKRVGRWKKKGRVCSFLLFPLANTDLGPRVGSWYHKGPFYMPVSTVSCLESEKTRASNAFHYAIAWGCQLVKGLDLVGWSGGCAN